MLLLLKSSDRVAHDICHAFDACAAPPEAPVRHALALRKWIALKPERELRCFVRRCDLIGAFPWLRIGLRQLLLLTLINILKNGSETQTDARSMSWYGRAPRIVTCRDF